MLVTKLKEQIKAYKPYNEQEECDKRQMLEFMNTYDDVLTRDNIMGHFTSSAFIVNKERTKMIMVYHIINDCWMYLGGHADGEEDLLSVALKEAKEETNLDVKVLDKDIFSIQSVEVHGHIKRGKYVSAHIHFDTLYLMEADEDSSLEFRKEESKGIKWVSFEDAINPNVCGFMAPFHKKIISKFKKKYNS